MKLTTWLIMSFIEVLVILSLSGVCAAEDFTLSDDALMTMLDRTNYHVWAKSSIVDRRDRPGPGVEFDIYFPGTRTPENHLDCVSVAEDPSSLLFATDLRSFDAFTLKFTLLAVNGDPKAIHTGRLVVGAYINGSYRPECVTLDKQTPVIGRNNKRVADPNTAISRTTFKSSEIHSAGFTMHQLTSEGWDPNGTTITFLIEPAPGAVVIPKMAAENPPALSCIVIYVV